MIGDSAQASSFLHAEAFGSDRRLGTRRIIFWGMTALYRNEPTWQFASGLFRFRHHLTGQRFNQGMIQRGENGLAAAVGGFELRGLSLFSSELCVDSGTRVVP